MTHCKYRTFCSSFMLFLSCYQVVMSASHANWELESMDVIIVTRVASFPKVYTKFPYTVETYWFLICTRHYGYHSFSSIISIWTVKTR